MSPNSAAMAPQGLRPGAAVLVLAMIAAVISAASAAEAVVHKSTFRTAPFQLGPGGVHKKFAPIAMPPGHYGIRSFNAEIRSPSGPVPLSQAYLHHWIAAHIFLPKEQADAFSSPLLSASGWYSENDPAPCADGVLCAEHSLKLAALRTVALEGEVLMGNSAALSAETKCGPARASSGFGIGAETRHTYQHWNAPYAVEIGNPAQVPEGSVEMFWAQVHLIDTRAAVSAKRCLECFCPSYNVTADERGRRLPEGYIGGLLCCYEGHPCAQKEELLTEKLKELRTFWLEYTVEWVEWDECVVPVRTFAVDVTECQIEYNVEPCVQKGELASCVDIRRREVQFNESGRLVYAAGHQHVGALGISLRKLDGTVICDSRPMYGEGEGVGNEAGYVVGMGMCVPPYGSEPYIRKGETYIVESSYSKVGEGHTGVMGLVFSAIAVDSDLRAGPTAICNPPHPQLPGVFSAEVVLQSGQNHIFFSSQMLWLATLLGLVIGAMAAVLIVRPMALSRQDRDRSFPAVSAVEGKAPLIAF